MIKNFADLAERLKGIKIGDKDITPELLKEAVSKEEEFTLTVPAIHLMTEDGLTELKTTVKKQGYEEGKTAGAEMLIKDMKQKAGLEYEGKSGESFISELTKKVEREKGIEPNKKIQELTESLTNLQGVVQQKTAEVADWSGKFAALQQDTLANDVIMGKMPKNINGVSPRQFIALFKMEGYNIADDNGVQVVTRNGKALKDQLEKPIPVESVVLDFAKTNNWITSDGRGGGSDTGGKPEFKTMNDVFKYLQEKNIDPMSPDGMRLQDEFAARTQA